MFGLSFWKTKKQEQPQEAAPTTGNESPVSERIDAQLNQAQTLLQDAQASDSVIETSEICQEQSVETDESTQEQQNVLDRIALRPEGEFILFEQAANELPRRILEIGIDDAQRAICLLEFCSLVVPPADLFYQGMDWFEERTAEQKPGVDYMQAFQMFRKLGVQAKLQPGDPGAGFLGVANSLTAKKVDWIMISEEIGSKIMRKLWPLFPRIIDNNTRFFIEKGGRYRLVPPREVNRIAQKAERIQAGR